MNKVKFLTGLVLLLLLANVCLSMLIFMNKMESRHPEGPRDEIIQKLQFDKTQVKQYDSLISIHRSGISNAQDKIRNLKNKLYSSLKTNAIQNDSDSLIAAINNIQRDIEYIHLHHFRDIQRLCTPEQQPYFDALTTEIARLFAPLPPPHHKR